MELGPRFTFPRWFLQAATGEIQIEPSTACRQHRLRFVLFLRVKLTNSQKKNNVPTAENTARLRASYNPRYTPTDRNKFR